jgi:hypothetical protein
MASHNVARYIYQANHIIWPDMSARPYPADVAAEVGTDAAASDGAGAGAGAGPPPMSYGVSELTRLLCCINCNSHTLYAREDIGTIEEPAGTAVYLQGSAFNHSCCPTAEFHNAGRGLADIPRHAI